jgi:ATP-dependent protease HslVU (ClpYQ) peptidase subunit
VTCIVGLAHGDKVYIGGDSAGVDQSFSVAVRADRKVFRNGEMLFGIAGSFRMGNLLQHRLVVPQRDEAGDVFRYMVTDFIDAVRRTMHEGGVMLKEDNLESMDGDFLCAIAGRIFVVYGDMQVGENLEPYVSIGIGAPIAEGSMFSTKGKKPEDRVRLALEAAEEHSGGVRGPFHIESV